jgi:hypothetical protein
MIAKGDGQALCDTGVARNVDAEHGVCDVEIEGKAPTEGALIGNAESGVMVVPKDGSVVAVVWVSKTTAVVVMVAEVEEIRLMGGQLGGLVKVEELVKKLNAVEKDLNSLKQVFLQDWVPVSQDGGAALKTAAATWAGRRLTETQKSDIENEKVKQ